MDKFLMSSPTQLSQPFDVGNDSTLIHVNGVDMYDSQIGSGQDTISQSDLDAIKTENGTKSDNLITQSELDESNESLEEMVPISNKNYHNADSLATDIDTMNLIDFYNSSDKFQHSKNISLDDGYYNSQLISNSNQYQQKFSHQSKLSASSMVSVNQDPPSYSQVDRNRIHQSFSNNTIYSIESVPALSSSVSNQSLLDSPLSIPQVPCKQPASQHSVMATPRKVGRNKSLSVSSITNSITPLRGGNSTTLSPINLINNKVGKTPYSAKVKGHSRSRSRLSIDASNTSLLLNSATKSSSFQNLANPNLNPFYTPSSYMSSRNENSYGDSDEIGTPLPTPTNSGNLRNFSSQQPLNTYLSPTNNWNNASNGRTCSTPCVLKRNDTLDSINIEDQDDDAFKELKKVKSYSNFNSSLSSWKSHTKLKKFNNQVEEDLFFNAADLSLKLAAQLASNKETDTNVISSNSTPGNVYSPSARSFSSNSILPTTSYSVPSTVGASVSDFESSNNTNSNINSDLFNSQPYKTQGIDLMSPQIVSSRLNTPDNPNKLNKNLTKNLNLSTKKFINSYPASIDLASIAISPMNSSLSAPPTSTHPFSNYQSVHPQNPTGLLPPMATFPVLNQLPSSDAYQLQGPPQPLPHFPPDIKLPIKISDKTDIIDPKKKHQCPLCQARFQRPEHVKRHMKSHSSEKPFECDEPNCGKRFNRKDNLKAHLKKIHGRKL